MCISDREYVVWRFPANSLFHHLHHRKYRELRSVEMQNHPLTLDVYKRQAYTIHLDMQIAATSIIIAIAAIALATWMYACLLYTSIRHPQITVFNSGSMFPFLNGLNKQRTFIVLFRPSNLTRGKKRFCHTRTDQFVIALSLIHI